jgi:hypothetical protein
VGLLEQSLVCDAMGCIRGEEIALRIVVVWCPVLLHAFISVCEGGSPVWPFLCRCICPSRVQSPLLIVADMREADLLLLVCRLLEWLPILMSMLVHGNFSVISAHVRAVYWEFWD